MLLAKLPPSRTGRRMTSTTLATVSCPSPLKPLAVTEEVTTLVHLYIVKEKQLMTGIPFSENVTRLSVWELLSTTLQRANAFAIKKRYYETLPNTDEVP